MHPVSSIPPAIPRDTRGPTPVAQLRPIAEFAARARELDLLSQRIVPALPAPLRDHVRWANLRNDQLLLLVDAPAWATRARMEQRQILSQVRRLGLAAATLATRVMPRSGPDPSDNTTTRPAAQDPAQRLRSMAAMLTDPELKAFCLELASSKEPPARS